MLAHLEEAVHATDEGLSVGSQTLLINQTKVHQERRFTQRSSDDGRRVTERNLPQRDKEADEEVVAIELAFYGGECHIGETLRSRCPPPACNNQLKAKMGKTRPHESPRVYQEGISFHPWGKEMIYVYVHGLRTG